MTILPIIERELRVASRQWRMYYGRSLVAATALLVVLYLLWVFRMANVAPGGGYLLRILVYFSFGICAFSGLNRTGDCLSVEKRDDTLGLLFLTHLKGYDIVLGKLLANSMRVAYGLVAAIPVLGVAVLLGGVTGTEMFRIPLVLANTLLLSLSLGLLGSALCRKPRAGSWAATMAMLGLLLLPLGGEYLADRYGRPALLFWTSVFSPSFSLSMAFGSSVGLKTNFFWTAFATQFGLAVTAIAASSLILPRVWQIKASGPLYLRLQAKFAEWTHGDVTARRCWRSRLLAVNPIYWLNCRDRLGRWWPAVFTVLVFSALLALIAYYEIPAEPAQIIGFFGFGTVDFYLRGRVASLAATRLAEDRQSGALELILATPTSVRDILRGQLRATWWHLGRTAVIHWLGYFVYASIVILRTGGGVEEAVVMLAVLIVSVFDFFNLAQAGMWYGMRASHVRNAAGFALLRVLVAPWCAFAASMPVLMQFRFFRDLADYTDGFAILAFALAIWSANSIWVLRTVRHNLLNHFREAATDRYNLESRIGWRSLARWWNNSGPRINLVQGPTEPVLR